MMKAYQICYGGLLGKIVEAERVAPEGFTFTAPEGSPDAVWQWAGRSWREISAETAELLQQEAQYAEAEERLTALGAAIDAERDARIAAGMPYAFPDGKGTVQLRNERDITNVIGVGTSGLMLTAAGDAETTVGFRDQEDVTHPLAGAQAQALGQAVMAWMSAHYAAAWAHKDAVKRLAEAGDLAALDAYDIGAGWPEVGAAAAA